MKKSIMFVLLLACAAQAQQSKAPEKAKKAAAAKHEAAENKAWTVSGGASLGVKRCHKDIERLCKDVKPGEGRLGQCLKANAAKLSKSCKRWLEHGGQGHVDRAFQEIDKAKAAPLP